MFNYFAAVVFILMLVAGGMANAKDLPQRKSAGASTSHQPLLDPTRPLGYRESVTSERKLQLQAIFLGGGRKQAIINGVIVNEGDSVSGKRVVKIRPQEVVYEASGNMQVLKLRPSIFKK